MRDFSVDHLRLLFLILLSCFLRIGGIAAVSYAAIKPAENLPADSSRLVHLYNLSRQNLDAPVELLYLDTLMDEAIRQNNIQYQALVHRSRVRYYYNRMVGDSIAFYSELAIPFLSKHKQYDMLLDLEAMEINMHSLFGEYEFALMKSSKMYAEALHTGSMKGLISACENMGFAYRASYCFVEAIDRYKEGLRLLDVDNSHPVDKMKFIVEITECMFSLKQMDSVKVYLDSIGEMLYAYDHEKGEEELQKARIKVPEYWLWYYSRSADLAISKKRLDEVMPLLVKAECYVNKIPSQIFFETLYYAYMEYYLETGNYKKALDYEQKAAGVVFGFMDAYDPEMLCKKARIYEKMGNFNMAATLYEEALVKSDSLSRQRFAAQTFQLRKIYNIDKLEEEGRREQLDVQYLTTMRASLGIVVVILLIVILMFYKYKRKLSLITALAEESDVQASAFLDNMSREIRLSLEEIASLSSKLIDGVGVDERRKYVEVIQDTNQTLQHVIFNVLDVSKIESSRMTFNYAKVYLPGVFEELKSVVGGLIPPEVTFISMSDDEIYFNCDPTRLMQVLGNLARYLLANTTQGCIRVGCRVSESKVDFFLSDTGLTLSPESCATLFDRKTQTGFKLRDMGLDLVISKQLILKMGGVISVESDEVRGTVMSFSLPTQPQI